MSRDEQQRALDLVREAGQLHFTTDAHGNTGFHVSHVMSQDGPSQQAIKKYTEALDLWPECTLALVQRCLSRKLVEDIVGAQEDARKVLALDPELEYYSVIASVFEGEEARSILRLAFAKADETSYEYWHLRSDVADSFGDEGNYEAQARELEALRNVDLKEELRVSIVEALGTAYHNLGELEKAVDAYREGLPDTIIDLLEIQVQFGDAEATLLSLQENKTRLSAKDLVVYSAVTKALAKMPVPELELAMKAIDRTKAHGFNLFAAGVLCLSAGKLGLAHTYLTRVVNNVAPEPRNWHPSLRWQAEIAECLLRSI